MMPPFIIDSQNSAEVFLSNMDYAQVGAAVVVQEFIDGLQNDYLETVQKQYPDRFLCCGMADYRQPGFLAQAQELIEQRGFRGIAIPGHRLRNQGDRSMIARTERIKRPVPLISASDHGPVPLISDEMMRMFHLMEQKDVVLSITLEDGDRQVGELREVISECPELRIAIGHLGMANPPQTPCWENPSWRCQMALAQHAHVMIEMGGITWLYNAEFYPFPSAIRAIREAIDIAGADKLMWGSDYPRTITAITYRMSYDFILKSSELSDADKRLILGENALRFYSFTALPELPYIKNMSE